MFLFFTISDAVSLTPVMASEVVLKFVHFLHLPRVLGVVVGYKQ